MFSPDTLTADRLLLDSLATSGRYDYASQLTAPSSSWIRDWWDWVYKLLRDMERTVESQTLGDWLILAGGIVLIAILFYVCWRNRGRWFLPLLRPRTVVSYSVSDDSIYGTDFDAQLHQAWTDTNYAECVRLLYLRHLRRLSDERLIDWQPHRTPDTYVAQLPPGEQRQALQRLTAVFVRVRYGHYPTSRDEVERLAKQEGGGL